MGKQREDRTVWRWVGKDKEQGKSNDVETGMGLYDGGEVCSKGCAYGIVGKAAKSKGNKVSPRYSMKPGRGF